MKRFCYVVLAIVFSLFLFSAANAEMIPAGTYTVGEDIPAGSYSISCAGNDQVMFDLWGRAVKDHSSNGGNLFQVWVKPGENGSIGKITVEEGNQVEIVHGALNFEKYSGLTSDTIPSGVYTVGEDIPAGSYTVSCAGNDQVMLDLWGRAVKDHSSNGGNLFQVWVKPEENGRIGKITIEEGNQVEIVDGALNFEKYSGLTSDITPSGVYTVGEDIPAGSYTVSCVENKEVLFHLWGKSAGDTSSNGGSIYQVWIKPGENGRIGKISIEEGNVVEIIHGSVNFVEYNGLDTDTIPSGVYIIGEDIPAGSYTVSCAGNEQAFFCQWGAAIGDTSSNGGSIYQAWITPGETGKIGKITLDAGNVIEINGMLRFEQYQGFSF